MTKIKIQDNLIRQIEDYDRRIEILERRKPGVLVDEIQLFDLEYGEGDWGNYNKSAWIISDTSHPDYGLRRYYDPEDPDAPAGGFGYTTLNRLAYFPGHPDSTLAPFGWKAGPEGVFVRNYQDRVEWSGTITWTGIAPTLAEWNAGTPGWDNRYYADDCPVFAFDMDTYRFGLAFSQEMKYAYWWDRSPSFAASPSAHNYAQLPVPGYVPGNPSLDSIHTLWVTYWGSGFFSGLNVQQFIITEPDPDLVGNGASYYSYSGFPFRNGNPANDFKSTVEGYTLDLSLISYGRSWDADLPYTEELLP